MPEPSRTPRQAGAHANRRTCERSGGRRPNISKDSKSSRSMRLNNERTHNKHSPRTAGLDAKQTAALHLFTTPKLEMNSPALRNQVEEWLMIER
jgi:hypothetical protein